VDGVEVPIIVLEDFRGKLGAFICPKDVRNASATKKIALQQPQGMVQ